MKQIRVIFLLSTLLLHAFDGHGASLPYNQVELLQNINGLSNSSINTIFQDSRGMIWLGTWDGLNAYNGERIESFRPDVDLEKSISYHVIRSITEDQDAMLWISTDNGINRFDRFSRTFETYFVDSHSQSAIRENSFQCVRDTAGNIWAAVFHLGLFRYNRSNNEFDKIEIAGVNTHFITRMGFDRHNHLWLLINQQEVVRLAPKQDKKGFHSTQKLRLPASTSTFLFDSKDRFWGQYPDGKLFFLPTYQPNLRAVDAKLSISGELHDVKYHDQKLFFATSQGLVYSDPLVTHPQRMFEHLSLFSLFFDSDSTLWLGTDSQGVIYLLPLQKPFYSFNSSEITALGSHPVRAITRGKENTLWIGTKGGGIVQIEANYSQNRLRQLRQFNTQSGLTHNAVLSLKTASDGSVWIGSDGQGLQYIHPKTEKLERLHGKGLQQPQLRSVYALLPIKDSLLWVGTSGNGLFRIALEKRGGLYSIRNYKQYSYNSRQLQGINNDIVYDVALQNDSLLWVATRGGGLNCLNLRTNRFKAYKNEKSDEKSLSSNDVICLLIDQKNDLWIGTGNGLNKAVRLLNGRYEFDRYTERNGLPNSCIHSIQEDRDGMIWASTNKGIFRLHPSGSVINGYDYKDGLQSNEFSDGASFADNESSHLFFGGVQGVTLFNPMQIKTSHEIPPLSFDELKVNHTLVPLHRDLKSAYKFGYTSQYLSFRFSIFNYQANQKCKLAYRLSGGGIPGSKNDKWIELTTREIILSNLQPGEYTLSVRHSNSDNVWSNQPLNIPFRIRPPFWLSTTAIIIYLLILLALIWFVVKTKQNRMRLAHSLELETLEKNKVEEIHQAKLRFFTNIAHEFSNSITLIYGPSERILTEPGISERTRAYLLVIRKNAERMQNLIQQLMEFRKADTGHLKLFFEKVDLRELIRYTTDNFKDLFAEKDIHLELTIDKNLSEWISDRDSLEKIIFNLVSNAGKYTPQHGWIRIQALLAEDRSLQLTCKNSGEGISENDLQQIFNRFQILDNIGAQYAQGKTSRTGIGLALCQSLTTLLHGKITASSVQGKETTFTLLLPPLSESNHNDRQSTEKTILPTAIAPTINTQPQKNKGQFPRILVVDDDPDIRFLIRETLCEQYQISEASDGTEGFDLALSLRPDLILSDVVMPQMGGIEMIRALKANDSTQHIPIILISSKVTVESHIEGLNVGAVSYLNKPFHPNHLLATVASLLGNSETTRQYLASPKSHKVLFEQNEINREDYEFINHTYDILSQHINDEEYNQEALAKELYMSKVQFYRRIKRITGRTPSDFIRQFRLQEVERLLNSSTKTVQEIMYDCGFKNKAYFFREFAKAYGCTPKEFRQKKED